MADAAVSAVLFAAKIAIRVAMLVQQNKANLKYADDLLARVNSINHVLGMLSKLPPEMLADLASMTSGLQACLNEVEEYVQASVAKATSKSWLKKGMAVHDAEGIRDKLAAFDDKLSRHLQVLTAAQGAKQLQQSARLEEQISKLSELSSSMFAFSLLANGMQSKRGAMGASTLMAAAATEGGGMRRHRRRRIVDDDDDDEEEDDGDEEDDEDEDGDGSDGEGRRRRRRRRGRTAKRRTGASGNAKTPDEAADGAGAASGEARIAVKSPDAAGGGGGGGGAGSDSAVDDLWGGHPRPSEVLDALQSKGLLPGAANPEDLRTAKYAEMATHQFICGSFVGAMAMMSDNDGQRLAIVATVPLMPVLTLLAFAWWAGQLKASCMATGVRAFTRMCWTVYRLYATPGIFAAVLLTFMGHFNDPNTAAVYSSFLWACTGGIAMFLGLYWLAEDAQ